MGFKHHEWHEIEQLIAKMVADVGEPIVRDVVVKSNEIRKLVWTREFGDTPIPCVGFDYKVKYYTTSATGVMTKKIADAELQIPVVGDIVVILKQLGSDRLPLCLGKQLGFPGTG